MDKIEQLLQPYNIEASVEEVAKLCAQVGADMEQLTDKQAQAIAQHIIEQRSSSGKLATNGRSKNGSGKLGKNSPRRKAVPPLQGAIGKASQVSNQEIQSLDLSEILTQERKNGKTLN